MIASAKRRGPETNGEWNVVGKVRRRLIGRLELQAAIKTFTSGQIAETRYY